MLVRQAMASAHVDPSSGTRASTVVPVSAALVTSDIAARSGGGRKTVASTPTPPAVSLRPRRARAAGFAYANPALWVDSDEAERHPPEHLVRHLTELVELGFEAPSFRVLSGFRERAPHRGRQHLQTPLEKVIRGASSHGGDGEFLADRP